MRCLNRTFPIRTKKYVMYPLFVAGCFLIFSGMLLADISSAQSPSFNKVSTKGNAKTLGSSDFYDDFERAELGSNWTGSNVFEIREGELVNTSTENTWSHFLSICNTVIDPEIVELTYGEHTDATGRASTGLAVLLDEANEAASGYLIYRAQNQIRLYGISGGEVAAEIDVAGGFSNPGAGDVLGVKITSDQSGHHFHVLNNGSLMATLDDPQKRFNGVFCGVMASGNTLNGATTFYCSNPNDTRAPMQIADLRVVAASFASVILEWTAPGNNDDLGRASYYDIRYSTNNILSDQDFEAATSVTDTIPPQPAGETEQFYIGDLESGITYYFAIKAFDYAGNASDLSNEAAATTSVLVPVKDTFNRADGSLGSDWSGDVTNIQIRNNAAQNIAIGDIWSPVISNKFRNVYEVTLKYGPEATAYAISFSGIVLMADNPSSLANGYMIQHFSGANPADPTDDGTRLWLMQNGRLVTILDEGASQSGILPRAGTRITARVVMQNGLRYFYVYVNNVFDRVLSDPQNRYNGLYAGFFLESTLGAQNAVDEFIANCSPGGPKLLSKVSGDNQFGSIGQNLPLPLTVSLIDSFDNPLPNALVKFVVTSPPGGATITPPSKDNNIRLEAEDASIASPIQTRNDPEASGGKFIAYPTGQTADAAATFTFEIKTAGTYRIWTRSLKTGSDPGSWSLSVDGSPTFIYDVFQGSTVGTWSWDLVSARGNGTQYLPQFNPRLFSLQAGTHTLVFNARWEDTRLDKILITSDANYSPSGKEESGFITDVTGQTSATVTLGDKAGPITIQASHGNLQPITFNATATGGTASKLMATGGANQSGPASQPLPQPFKVTVQDNSGNGVAGQVVSWVVTSGNGTLSEYTSTSDINGLASTILTLGNAAATNTAEARAPFATTPVVFTATTISGLAANAAVASGNSQSGPVHAALPAPLVAKVMTAAGLPVANFPVEFRVVRGGGTLSPNLVANNGGFESANIGVYTPAAWNLEGTPAANEVLLSTTSPHGGAKSLQVNSSRTAVGVSQTVDYPAASAYTLSFFAKVASGTLRVTWQLSDALGNPINKIIDITAAATGANWRSYVISMVNGAAIPGSLSFKTFGTSGNFFVDDVKICRNTDSNGEIAVNWTLGDTAMTQTLRAEIPPGGIGGTALSGSPLLFTAKADPGAAKRMALVSGNNQDGSAGQVLNAPLVVRVMDDFGNGIPNRSVKFTVTAGGGILNNNLASFTTNTDKNGLAQARWTLGSAAGDTNRVQATSTGLNAVKFVAFAAVPSKVTKVPQSGISGSAGHQLDQPLVVRVTDASGKRISGYPVVFKISQGNGKINDSTQAIIRTDSLGEARAYPVLGPTPGVQNRINAWINYNGQTLPSPALTFTVTAARLKQLSLVSGNNQTGTAGELLAEPFKVKVLDSLGVGIKGQAITFAVIKGGGKLGVDTVRVVSTDAQGIAQTKLTLGAKPGTNQVTAKTTANLAGSPLTFTATGIIGVATTLKKFSGDSLAAIVNTVLPSPLVAQVVDKLGNGIANARVKFAVIAGGGKLNGKDSLTVTTDANGKAQVSWQLGGVTGKFNNKAEARSFSGTTELANSPVLFVASALSNAARSIKVPPGGITSFTGRAGDVASSKLIVKVTDGSNGAGNGVLGHPVQFVVVRGGGRFDSGGTDTTVSTDDNGLARVSWTFGGALGTASQEVRVTSNGVNGRLEGAPIVFTANVDAGFASVEGSYVQATGPVPADGVTLSRVTVFVRDRFGNPIAGEGITIVVTPSNNVIDQPATKTDAQGKVTGSFTSRVAGTKLVTAKVLGGIDITRGATVQFTPLAANQIKVVSGNNQTCNVGAAMTQPLVVKVADKFENGVPDYPVQFIAKGQGRILETMPVKTDSSGMAKATFIAGASIGQTQIWAEAAGLNNSPLIFLANVVNSPAQRLEAISGNGQTGQAGIDLPEPLVARVTDSSGRPVSGAPVKFDVTYGDGTIYGQDPFVAQTDELGEARVIWRLGPLSGPNTLRIEAQGLAGSPIDFHAQAGAGAPAILQIAAGQRASGSVGTTMPQALVVRVTDGVGNGVDNVPVLFDLVDGSGSLAGASTNVLQVKSSNGGYASVQFTFGNDAGWRIVRTSAYGLQGSPTTFYIYGRALAAQTMKLVERTNNQRGTKGKPLNFPLQVLVQDRLGNPVPNENITFLVTGGGGNFNGLPTFEATTDTGGIAAAPWTLGASASANDAVATRSGLLPSTIAFQATGFDNDFPIIAEVPDRRVTEGDAIEFVVSATDADGDVVKYGAKNLPLGAQFDSLGTRTFSWATHASSAGHYEVSFFARDGKGGVDEEIVIIDVKNRNRLPVILSRFPIGYGIPARPDTAIDLNATLLMRVQANDPDNDPLNYRWYLNGQFAGSTTNTFLLQSAERFNTVIVFVFDREDTASSSWLIQVPVKLSSFSAALESDGAASGKRVILEWRTESEMNNIGFNVLRSPSRDGRYEKINRELIPARRGGQGRYTFVDAQLEAGSRYFYKLEDVDVNGHVTLHGPVSVEVAAPKTFTLHQNYPNPFWSEATSRAAGSLTTQIRYELPKAGRVTLSIYNSLGQEVRRLVDQQQPLGYHLVTWNGRDQQGKPVPTGVYHYRLQVGDFVATRKMLIAK